MPDIFTATDNDALLERIERLTPTAKPLWGKMTVAQMLAHCRQPIRVAFGELAPEGNLFAKLFGKAIKKIVLGPKEFGKNSPTDKHFIIRHEPEFEQEQKSLSILVRRFREQGPAAITSKPHPLFGKMTVDEWNILMWKHLDHHLRQFGV